jgi:replicative DNA helicase
MTPQKRTPAERELDGGQINGRAGSDPPSSVTPPDPATPFIGSLMHLPAPAVVDALSLMRAEDFADQRLALLADVCGTLAGSGRRPDPVQVLAHIRREAVVSGATAMHNLAVLIYTCFASVPVPEQVGWYRLAVLDEALRRRCTELADRIRHASAGDSISTLMTLLGTEVNAVSTVQGRRLAAARGEVDP